MIIVLLVMLLIVIIDYILGNKISDTITGHIENICNKLHNKKPTDVNQMIDADKEKKEIAEFFMKPKLFDKKEYLSMQGLPVNTPSFNVPISFNTPINILEMVG